MDETETSEVPVFRSWPPEGKPWTLEQTRELFAHAAERADACELVRAAEAERLPDSFQRNSWILFYVSEYLGTADLVPIGAPHR